MVDIFENFAERTEKLQKLFWHVWLTNKYSGILSILGILVDVIIKFFSPFLLFQHIKH